MRVYAIDQDLARDLAVYSLETLGYWLEAEEAQACWDHKRPWWPLPDTDLPLSMRQEIGRINAQL